MSRRVPPRTSFVMLMVVCAAADAVAQTTAPTEAKPLLGNSFAAETLSDLPSATTIYSLLDGGVAAAVADRVDAGTLMPGEAARVGQGTSWTQTTFRVGDVDISDPEGSGSPLLVPGVLAWERVDVATGAMDLDLNAPGLAVTLLPRRPSRSWTRSLDLFGAGPSLVARRAGTNPPAISTPNSWAASSLLVSGPLVPDRLGIVFAADWTQATRFERDSPTELRGGLASAFTHLVFVPTARDELRLLAWVQRGRSPFGGRLAFGQPLAAERDSSVHVQTVWERQPAASTFPWAGFLSVTQRSRATDLEPSSAIVMDRLNDGPVSELVAPLGTDRVWSLGVRARPSLTIRRVRHALHGGLTVSGADARVRTPFTGSIGERVSGLPARVWQWTSPGGDSRWRATTVSIYAGDRIAVVPRLIVEGGVRFEAVNGSAAASADRVAWHDWFPRTAARLNVTHVAHIDAFATYNRYGYRLPLRYLAYGDPWAPLASVFQWTRGTFDPPGSNLGPLVARVGPGTGGDPRFSAIDPRLERPYVDELTLGFDSRPNNRTTVHVAAIARRQRELIGLVDTAVPPTSYSVSTIRDQGVDHSGGQLLRVYNRTPAMFGADRYLLTNPADDEATFVGVDIAGEAAIDHLTVFAGATATRSQGLAANRGFDAIENDEGVIGEAFANPNARTNARGRLFTERGYTVKTGTVFRFPHDTRLGLLARYQDGQHFARLVVVQGLNQGVEAIRAFANGETRFTYTLTIDARLQKRFLVGSRRFTAVVDAYNLLNWASEIEEFTVTGPSSRKTSAVQPPRSIHLGVRIPF